MSVKIRFKFSRDERLRFLSHLDMQRMFQRAFRRAGIQTEYSNGFNPHIRLSFAGALPLGMITDNEYGEIILTDEMPLKDFIQKMNAVLPPGLVVKEASFPNPKAPSLAAGVRQADYTVTLFDQVNAANHQIITDSVDRFLQQPEIIICKRNKKGKMVEADLRPYLLNLAFIDHSDDDLLFKLSIKYIDQKCIKAIQVFQALNDFGDLGLKVDESLKLHKTDMLI